MKGIIAFTIASATIASGSQCAYYEADMALNDNLKNIPEFQNMKNVTGKTTCLVCPSRIVPEITCDTKIYENGLKLDFIASHIHNATNGNGATGSGPPIVNLCGDNVSFDNSLLIQDGTNYSSPCQTPTQQGIKGNFVKINMDFTTQEIMADPSRMYINYHTNSSWTYWKSQNAGPLGLIRGQLKFVRNQVCTNLKVHLNLDQSLNAVSPFDQSQASGLAVCSICDDLTIGCETMLQQKAEFSEIIASHFHLANDGNGATGSGNPVINFCGNNEGPSGTTINDGTNYTTMCPQLSAKKMTAVKYMKGAYITATNGNVTYTELLRDVRTNPNKYYLNFHTKASLAYWSSKSKGPLGFIRGQVLSANQTDAPTHAPTMKPTSPPTSGTAKNIISATFIVLFALLLSV